MIGRHYDFDWRKTAVQIDLVLNWNQVADDNIVRHVKLTNR